MGKTFGILALIFGLIAILAGAAIMGFIPVFGNYIMYALCILTIIFAIIGILKDESKILGIVGLILGIIAVIRLFIYIIFVF